MQNHYEYNDTRKMMLTPRKGNAFGIDRIVLVIIADAV